MTIDVTLPSLAPTMTEARLGGWLKQVGAAVREGEAIAEIESEKSVTELASPADGYLIEILVAANTDEVPVGTLLARIGDAPAVSAAVPSTDRVATLTTLEPPADASGPATAASATIAASSPPAPRPADLIDSTPLAARVARLVDADAASIRGSGPAGRLMLRDLPIPSRVAEPERIEPRTSPVAPTVIPHNAHRRVTARRLTEAKQRIPHFYLQTKIQVDRLLQLRSEINAQASSDTEPRISINDCVVRAVAMAIAEIPEINVAWADEGLISNSSVDVAVAVAALSGLVTPVVREADRVSLREIARRTRALADRARANALLPAEYQGGSCTVSNLGMHGIDGLFAIVNPPQSFIVGVGRVVDEPVIRNGAVTAGRSMQCTLSGDHRAIDGVVGARLLSRVRDLLDSPLRLLV